MQPLTITHPNTTPEDRPTRILPNLGPLGRIRLRLVNWINARRELSRVKDQLDASRETLNATLDRLSAQNTRIDTQQRRIEQLCAMNQLLRRDNQSLRRSNAQLLSHRRLERGVL